jgi:hypothetical protein
MTEGERESLFRRRGWVCEICRVRHATDLHHCLIRRDKRKPELNAEENYQCLCHYCHMSGYGDTRENRQVFWMRQVERYGYDHMTAYLEDLPLKVKHWDFLS